jgi:hypothetical protein
MLLVQSSVHLSKACLKNINSLADVLKTKIENINLDSLNIDLNNVQSLLEKFK